MLHQDALHLEGTDPEAAGLDDIVGTAHIGDVAVFVHGGKIPGVVHAALPDLVIGGLVAAVAHEDTEVGAVRRGHHHDLAGLTGSGHGAVLLAQLHVIKRRGTSHGTQVMGLPHQVGNHQRGLGLAEALPELEAGLRLKAAGNLGVHGLTGGDHVLDRVKGAEGDAPLDEEAVDGGRGAEGGDLVLHNHIHQRPGVELVVVIDHDGCLAQPLAVELAPGSLAPAGVGDTQMEAVLADILPVLGSENVAQGIGVVVHDGLGLAGGAGGEVEEHGLCSQGFHPVKVRRSGLDLGVEIHIAGHLAADEEFFHAGGITFIELLGAVAVVGGDHHGLHVHGLDAVVNVGSHEGMGRGDGHGAQLVERHDDVPVLIVSLEHEHHMVALADAVGAEDVGRLVAEPGHLGKGEEPLPLLLVAPDHANLLRLLLGQGVHHVIAEVEVFRRLDGKFREYAVFVVCLFDKLLIEFHGASC